METKQGNDGRDAQQDGGFDRKLERLEALVAELEQGGLGLEPAIERYQEGIGLLKECHRALERYQRRVEELSRAAEGEIRPFEGDPDVRGNAG